MNSVQSVDWNLLLETDSGVENLMTEWAEGTISTTQVTVRLAYSEFAGEFRRLVRTNGTVYGRRLARKALRRRGVNV